MFRLKNNAPFYSIGGILFLMGLFYLIPSDIFAISSTPKLIEKKMDLAQQIYAKHNQTISTQPKEIQLKWQQAAEGIIQAQKHAKFKRWKKTDLVLTQVLQTFMSIRSNIVKNQSKAICNGELASLKQTAKSLSDILEHSTSSTSDFEQIRTTLATLLAVPSDKVAQHKNYCLSLKNAINSSIAAIDQTHKNKTVYVSLDLSTPQKRYQYDKNRYVTYKLLLQQRLESLTLSDAITKKIMSHIQQANSSFQQAEKNFNGSEFKSAESLQVIANKNLVLALRLSGLYISE